MCDLPDWLSPPLRIADYDDDQAHLVEAAYSIFSRDFKNSPPRYNGISVMHDAKIINDKENAFWHIITSVDNKTGIRTFDVERCRRITWIKPLIENIHQKEIQYWTKPFRKEVRIMIWFEVEDYLVVIKGNQSDLSFITAYIVTYGSRRRKLRMERDKYS